MVVRFGVVSVDGAARFALVDGDRARFERSPRVLPAEMDDPDIVDRLRGETLEDARNAASVPVAVVDGRSGVVELIRPQPDETASTDRTG